MVEIHLGGDGGVDFDLLDSLLLGLERGAAVESADEIESGTEDVSEPADKPCEIPDSASSSSVSVFVEEVEIVREGVTYSGGYLFPANHPIVQKTRIEVSPQTSEDLLGILGRLLKAPEKASGKPLPYAKVRHHVVAISMLLNERQQCPPRFRPSRKMPKRSIGAKWDDETSILSNDRQVLDLHWLACSGVVLRPTEKWQKLFSADGLQFDAASEFVATVGEPANKIRELRIHDAEMRQLSVIQPKEMRDRWRDVRLRADEEDARFREWLEKNKNRAKVTQDELVNDFLVLGLVGDRYTEAAKLATLVAGKTIAPKIMQRRFDLFKKMGLLRVHRS